MDRELLVVSGQKLVRLLDKTELAPIFAMWVANSERESWKLWIVPPAGQQDKKLFYGTVSRLISGNIADLNGLEISDVELMDSKNPAVSAISSAIHVPDLGASRFGNNYFNGFYMPDGIILRSNLISVAA
jgi:hypothetical protein